MNYRFILLFIFFHVGTIKADLLIEITKGEEGALPIAIVPFGLKSETTIPPFSVSEIISANLARSGRFQPVLPSNMLSKPTKNDQVDFRDWRALNVENLVIGELVSDRPGAFLINFVLDLLQGTGLLLASALAFMFAASCGTCVLALPPPGTSPRMLEHEGS